MPQLQGQVTSFADVQAQPNYQKLPSDIQAQIALDYFDKRVATQASFQKAPPDAQEAMRQDFKLKYNVPDIQAAPNTFQSKPPQQVNVQTANPVLDWLGNQYQNAQNDYLMQAGDTAAGLKNASLGYVDITKGFQGDIAGADPYQQIRRKLAGGIGSVLPYVGAEGLFASGLKAAGTSLLPYTTEIAQAAGAAPKIARPAMEALSQLQGPSMLARMARMAMPFGAVGAAESQPGHQLDIGRRAQAAAMGALGGAVFPPLEEAGGALLKAGGKTLSGSVKYIQDMLNPQTERPISLGPGPKRVAAINYQKRLIDTFNQVKQTVMDIYEGRINHEHVDAADAKQLAKHLDTLEGALTGKNKPTPADLSEMRNTTHRIRGKASVRAKVDAKKFLPGPDGSPNSGYLDQEVADAIGLPAKPIRIEVKSIGHIKEHDTQAKKRGFKDAIEHAKYVIQNYNAVYEGKTFKDGRQSFILAVKKEGEITYIELAPSKGYYRVNTSHPLNPMRLEKRTPLWEGTRSSQTTSSGPDTSSQNHLLQAGVDGSSAEAQNGYYQNSTPQNAPQPPKQLTGSVKEMVANVAESANLPPNAGEFTAGQLEKQLGRKLSDAEKDIHTSLRAIARTDVVDAERGIHRQFSVDPATSLRFDAVKQNISSEYMQNAQIIDDAMAQGKAVRLEYAAEESGRSNEAAKITKAGNIKAETTTFTPLSWGKTKDGQVLLRGYNQRGHFTTYHLEPSANGSQILKAGKVTDKAFVGEYPNVYLGQRPFLAKDVLSRGARSESGPIKTSEAMSMLQNAANNLDEVFKLIDSGKINAVSNQALKELRDTPQWGSKELRKFQKLIQNRQVRNEVCKLLGLVHP